MSAMKPKKTDATRPPPTSPYRVPGATRGVLRRWVRTVPGEGALMVFVADVIAPPVVIMSYSIASATGFAYERWARAWIRIGLLSPPVIYLVLMELLLVMGAYRLTAGPRGEPISDELRAMTRLSAVANVVMLALIALTSWMADGIGLHFFSEASRITSVGVATCLALTAARHFAWVGARRAAIAAWALAAALPVGLVAEHFLTQWSHDALYNPIRPPYAHLVGPMNAGLWIWKSALLAMLWRVLAKSVEAPAEQEA